GTKARQEDEMKKPDASASGFFTPNSGETLLAAPAAPVTSVATPPAAATPPVLHLHHVVGLDGRGVLDDRAVNRGRRHLRSSEEPDAGGDRCRNQNLAHSFSPLS